MRRHLIALLIATITTLGLGLSTHNAHADQPSSTSTHLKIYLPCGLGGVSGVLTDTVHSVGGPYASVKTEDQSFVSDNGQVTFTLDSFRAQTPKYTRFTQNGEIISGGTVVWQLTQLQVWQGGVLVTNNFSAGCI